MFAKGKFQMTVNVVSSFGKEQNNLVSQSKLFDTIVRHNIKISEDHLTLPNYHEQ